MLDSLVEKFERIGARLVVTRHPPVGKPFDLDVRRDDDGEHFLLRVRDRAQAFNVLQANQAGRHLLLHAPSEDRSGGERFLCGHDERHWFVAAIADRVTSITDAKRSLLPRELKDAGLTPDDLAHRHNGTFVRQGEWFFVPTDKDLTGKPILHGEELRRGRTGKPHIVSELIRFGGQPVVLDGAKEYTPREWEDAIKRDPSLQQHRVRRMTKDAEVYVRGKVRHPDHATLTLDRWHRVYMNAEAASANVSFYD